MDGDFFAASDAAVARAGSTDPGEVAERLGIMVFDLTSSITALATRYSYIPVIGINIKLNGMWRSYGFWHEIGHIVKGHIDEPGFSTKHFDTLLFSQEIDCRSIPRHEKEANIISAEYNIDTKAILEIISYDTSTMQDYRRLKAYQEKLGDAYKSLCSSANADKPSQMIKYRLAEYQRSLKDLENKKRELESDIAAMGCRLSFREIAAELGTTETILKYKLEALRIRGYDIDTLELERYDKVFKGAM